MIGVQRLGEGVSRVLTLVVIEDDVGPFAGEGVGDRGAKATTGAGDEDHLFVEREHRGTERR
jgi:hypothetical protein